MTPGICSGCLTAPATRELVDPVTRIPLGVFVCDQGVKEFGRHNSRPIQSTAAPLPSRGSGATVGAEPRDVSRSTAPGVDTASRVRRSKLVQAG